MSLLSSQLLAFMAVVKHKTVHGAAEEIHLTQTAVTQRIRALERALRTSVFVRSRRGMLLTPEGEALYRYCHAAQELEGEALAIIQGAGTVSEVAVSISAPSSIMRSRVIPACLPVMQKYPQLLIHFNVNDIDNRHQALKAGSVDFAILSKDNMAQEMCCKPLLPERYVLVASARWKGRKLKDIIKQERIIDYDETDQVTLDYLRQHQLVGDVKSGRYFVNRTENLAYLVAQGIGYTTLAKEFAQQYVASGELIVLNQGRSIEVEQVLAWYDRPEPANYFASIINALN